MKRLLFVLLVCAAGAAACGGNGGPNDGGDVRGAYPAGPYGTNEGAIIESLSFMLSDGMPRTLEDVWKDNTKKLMLISTAAGWCTACIDEQPALVQYHHEYGPKGLFVVEAVFQDAGYQPATLEYTANWKRQYDLPFDVVVDPLMEGGSNKLSGFYDASAAPLNMIVDVTTMKILRVIIGVDPSAVQAIFDARLK